jgi:hypothetical protein
LAFAASGAVAGIFGPMAAAVYGRHRRTQLLDEDEIRSVEGPDARRGGPEGSERRKRE